MFNQAHFQIPYYKTEFHQVARVKKNKNKKKLKGWGGEEKGRARRKWEKAKINERGRENYILQVVVEGEILSSIS